MASPFFQCPRCQAGNAQGSRFCANCGLSFAQASPNAPVKKKNSLIGLWIALACIGLCGFCGLIGALTDKNKPAENQPAQLASNTNNQTNSNTVSPPVPPPAPTFAELKSKAETLLKFEKDEYVQGDLKQFDDVMQPLRGIPKTAKEYKEAQALNKKLIDKSAYIAAEILVLGAKPKNSEWDGRVDPVVTYLKANLNDYEDSEWLEWSPVTKVKVGKEPYWAVRLKLRAKNAFGAKIVKDAVFFIRNNQVVKTSGL